MSAVSIKAGVVGVGKLGSNHTRIYASDKRISEIFIYDINPARSDEVASMYGAKVCSTVEDVLEESDVVSICTPASTHSEIAMKAFEMGIDVLVEKPMTLSSAKANDLIEIAERNGNVLMVGHIFRYHSAVNEIRKKIMRGDFGDIYYIMSNRYSLRQPRRDMGVLFALGIHEVDLFCYLLNEEYPKKIFATT